MVDDPFMLPAGIRRGKYTILRRLAVGGMAELYLARADGISGFEKLCALKRIRPVLATDRQFVEMFLHEARIAAKLDHPAIAQVMDIGSEAGDDFFVMEYVHGRDLREILRRAAERGGLPLGCALAVAHGAARGLHYAHELRHPDGDGYGIVHRDVSPSNLIVSFPGDVKIIDFGIAKALSESRRTDPHVMMGKVGYMSPEQCRGAPVDRRSDIFSLGVVLYEATVGRRPFAAESQFAVLNMITMGEFPRPRALVPDYPVELEAVVLRAMAVDPQARYPTAEALQAELEDVMQQRGLQLTPRLLSSLMVELFGEQPLPGTQVQVRASLPTLAVVHSQEPAGVTAPAPRPLASPQAAGGTVPMGPASPGPEALASTSSPARFVSMIAVAAIAAGSAWWLARRSVLPTPSEAIAPVVVPEVPVHAGGPTAAASSTAAAAPGPAVDAAAGGSPRAQPATASGDPEPPPTRKPSRASRGQRASRGKPSEDAERPTEATRLFPRAYYDEK
jgi:eukaryotic-like serine/threonine-protein kinase